MIYLNSKEIEYCNIDKVHQNGIKGQGVKIAVIDNAYTKEKLWIKDPYGQLIPPFASHSGYSHGDMVMGVVHEVAPDSEIHYIPARPDLINNNLKGYQIINISQSSFFDLLPELKRAYEEENTLIVVSAGNKSNNPNGMSDSNNKEWQVTVGAVHLNNNTPELASYSVYNDVGDVDCVGFSKLKGEDGRLHYGTSFSAPWVTGMFALYYQWFKTKHKKFPTPKEARQFMIDNCKDLGEVNLDKYYGYGLFILPDLNINKDDLDDNSDKDKGENKMLRVVFDIGHGEDTWDLRGSKGIKYPDGTVFEEHHFNSAVAIEAKKLAEYNGFEVLFTQKPYSTEVSLKDRVDFANDEHKKSSILAFVSLHANASSNKNAKGHGVFHWYNSKQGVLLAQLWDKYADLLLPNPNWGKTGIWKSIPDTWSSFYVCRKTIMPAILIEHFFFTNYDELKQCNTPEFIKLSAEVLVRALCEYVGKIFKQLEEQKPQPEGFTILGRTQTTLKQMKVWARKRNANDLFISLADIYWEIANKKGVKPEIAYAQCAKETGFCRFGGVLDTSFKNPCGLKTSKGGSNSDPNAHQRFDTWEDGISAHIDHLALYAGHPEYPKKDTLDPRHFTWIKGKAPTVEKLGGKWAPNPNYGVSLVEDYIKDLLNTEYIIDSDDEIIDKLQKENDKLKAENSALQTENNELKEENNSLKKQIISLEKYRKELEDTIENYNVTINNQNQVIKSQNETIEELNVKISNALKALE